MSKFAQNCGFWAPEADTGQISEQTQGLHLQAKFHLNVFVVSVYLAWRCLRFLVENWFDQYEKTLDDLQIK